jgi:hypothetical protein
VVAQDNFYGYYDAFRFPQSNIIGLDGLATQKNPDQVWVESWPGALTSPPNLYAAQLQYRKGGQDTPPPTPTIAEASGT